MSREGLGLWYCRKEGIPSYVKQLGTCIYTMWGGVTTSVERKASCNTSSYLMLPYLTLRFR